MRWFRSVPLLFGLWILVTPSCGNHFQTGIVEVTDSHGTRTMHQTFHNGQLGRIGKGALFRAELQDGSVIVIWNKEAEVPEEHK